MNIPDDLKYTSDHEWVKINGNSATIGITDFAQSELGDVVYIDIDKEIEQITKGEPFGTIEAVKTVSDMNGPLSGKVTEVNALLEENPENVNSDPYGEGWMVKIEISDQAEITELLDSAAYKNLIG